jgi:hypothetical protein
MLEKLLRVLVYTVLVVPCIYSSSKKKQKGMGDNHPSSIARVKSEDEKKQKTAFGLLSRNIISF